MRLLLDENAPRQWLQLLREHGHDAVHVIDRGLVGASDDVVFEHAQRERRVLLTRNGFKRNPARRDSLNAMLEGLRIIRISARGLAHQAQGLRSRMGDVEAAFASQETLRRVTIMNDLNLRYEHQSDIRISLGAPR